MNQVLLISLFLFCTVCNLANAQDANVQTNNQQPNIIFIFVDDMGYGDLKAFSDAGVKTPNIDGLAEEGIRFTQFYVNSPICSPSRTAVTTGQYPLRWDITSFLGDSTINNNRGMAHYLDPEAPSLARILQDDGYYTAHVGKWHMGGQRNVEGAPLISEFGFNSSLTSFEGLGERLGWVFETRDWNGDDRFPLSVQQAKLGNGEVHWEKRYEEAELFVDRALKEIDTATENDQPFYINLWTDAVHTPLEARPGLRGDGSLEAHYYGLIRDLDNQLGRVFDRIRSDSELEENTIIVLASDNGPSPRVGSSGGLRGHKGNLYEGGIREPFIFWSPGEIAGSNKGMVNRNTLLAGMDLPPSLLSIAGVDSPDSIQFDGLDMGQVLLGKTTGKRSEPVMWVDPPPNDGSKNNGQPDLAIRDGEYKLLVNIDGSDAELYNIANNPAETFNLAEEETEITENLKDRVLEWFHDTKGDKSASVKPWQ